MYNIGVGRAVNAKAKNNNRDKYHRDRNTGRDKQQDERRGEEYIGIDRENQKKKKSERYGGENEITEGQVVAVSCYTVHTHEYVTPLSHNITRGRKGK